MRDLIDAAALAGRVEVRVIHGRGTGAVRKAVRDELSRHPLVDGQVADSSDGATVVRLGGNDPPREARRRIPRPWWSRPRRRGEQRCEGLALLP